MKIKFKPVHFLVGSYLVLMVTGGVWAFREKVHAQPGVFNQLCKKVDIDPVSFFGEKMWLQKYKPKSRFWRQILYWFPVNDYWHLSWYVTKSLYILAMWMAWKSRDYLARWLGSFWDLRKFWPLFFWVTIISMFWGGAVNALIASLLK